MSLKSFAKDHRPFLLTHRHNMHLSDLSIFCVDKCMIMLLYMLKVTWIKEGDYRGYMAWTSGFDDWGINACRQGHFPLHNLMMDIICDESIGPT